MADVTPFSDISQKASDTSEASKRIRLFALLVNHTSISSKSILLLTILNTFLELSIILDNDIMSIREKKIAEDKRQQTHGNNTYLSDSIDFLRKINLYYLTSKMDLTVLFLFHISIFLLLAFLCFVLVRPNALLREALFATSRTNKLPRAIGFVSYTLTNYQFLFIFCTWLFIQMLPCTELSNERKYEVTNKVKSFFNSFESQETTEVSWAKVSCLNENLK